MKRLLSIILMVGMALMAVPQDKYITKNYFSNGGATWNVGGTLTVLSAGTLNVASGGYLKINGTAISATAAELNLLNGVTAGTVTLSKAIVVDANKDIATFRNVTFSGTVYGPALAGIDAASAGNGGNWASVAGRAHTNGNGGNTSVTAGAGSATGTGGGGDATLAAGASGGGATGNGGRAFVNGGAAASTNGNGGSANLTAGAGKGTGHGGNTVIAAGASGAGATGYGGSASLTGGAAISTDGDGGAGSLVGGAAAGTGTGGAVSVTGGASAGGTGTAGGVAIDAGAATGGTGAAVTVGGTNAESVSLGRSTKAVTIAGNIRTSIGVGGIVANKCTAVEGGDGVIHQTTLTLTLTGDHDLDLADGDHGIGIKVYDMPEGRILILGVTVNGVAVVNNAFGADPNDIFYLGVGSVTAADDNTLAATEQDLIPTTTLDTIGNTTLTLDWHNALAASAQFDGTTTPMDIFVNVAWANATSTKAGTFAITGTIVITWANLGDY